MTLHGGTADSNASYDAWCILIMQNVKTLSPFSGFGDISLYINF